MALTYIFSKTNDSKETTEIKTFLNELVDILNTELYGVKKTKAKTLEGKTVLREVTEQGTYIGSNVNSTYKDLPEDYKSNFTLQVLNAPGGVVQILFSTDIYDFKIFARCVYSTRASEWKEI